MNKFFKFKLNQTDQLVDAAAGDADDGGVLWTVRCDDGICAHFDKVLNLDGA